METSNQLFDIFCHDKSHRRELEFKHQLHMSDIEFQSYEDQKGRRIGKCVGIVENLTPSDIKLQKMAGQSTSSIQQSQLQTKPFSDTESQESSTSLDTVLTTDEDDYYPAKKETKVAKTDIGEIQQNRMSFEHLSRACGRSNVSDRAGAAIATCVLKDYVIITDTETRHVIDRSKLRRERT